ncbi:hypothetical protein KOAAANKH_00750 [Brevundimonas sp. NIBR10]|uniref:hypothetical protein n=1 Tax=Brevundimonas sp. NIBR10 TaxID=3015997 RepID=UPI0022F15A38|nr:hypothetical protein [Brevundimonas sp. NIBR10]WGM45885.1 hypothetical protein KOAAANKH_00750 [Brevundimonas sp. NIBR10]
MTLMASRRSLLTTLGAAAALATLPAWQEEDERPGHMQVLSPDPLWTRFATTPIVMDRRSGAYTATFRPDVTRLAGRPITIMGFMLPLEAARATRHFGLMRKNHQCDFCPPSLPTEAIEVRLIQPHANTTDLIQVSGRLSLHPSSDSGFFFQLDQAVAR